MRSTVAILATAVILLAGAPAAIAKATAQQFSGQISHVDPAAKTLAVKEDGKTHMEMTFAIASDAKIMTGYKEASLGDLKVGEHVKVRYADVGSKHEATRIDVMHAKSAATKPYQKPNSK